MVCSEQKVTGQCTIKHYMSATNVQAEFVWSLQILGRTIYREEEQDDSATEPFADVDFEAIQQRILRQRRFFEINRHFEAVSRDIGRSVQLLSFSRYIIQ